MWVTSREPHRPVIALSSGGLTCDAHPAVPTEEVPMRRLLPALAAFSLFILTPAFADEAKPYIDNTVIDLTMILPPPPADDSARTREELGQVLTIQVTRTPEMVERAKADDEEVVWRFADVVGAKLSKDSLPLTAAFFD